MISKALKESPENAQNLECEICVRINDGRILAVCLSGWQWSKIERGEKADHRGRWYKIVSLRLSKKKLKLFIRQPASFQLNKNSKNIRRSNNGYTTK